MKIAYAIKREQERIHNLQMTASLRATGIESKIWKINPETTLIEARRILDEYRGELKALLDLSKTIRSACADLDFLHRQKKQGVKVV